MEFVQKNKKMLMVVGAVAAVVVVGKIANDKNGWFDKLTKKQLPGVKNPELGAAGVAKVANMPATAVPLANEKVPRGKLPWAVGDVGLWDDEDPSYCGNCSAACDQSYSNKSSTQCELCQAGCARGML